MRFNIFLCSSLIVLLAAPAAHAYYEIEEFDDGFGGYSFSPARIGRSATDGWVTVTNDSEKAARNSVTGTKYTYYWKLTRELDLSQAADPELELKFHFKGHEYEYFRVQVGPEGARVNADFTTLHEETDGGDDPTTMVFDLSEYQGEIITLRLLLKKPYGVTESKIGLYIHHIGVNTTTTSEPPPPEPNLVAVGAFNCQVFGKTKMGKEDVPQIIVDTITRYDLLAFQEIRDSSGTAIETLFGMLDIQTGGEYAMVLSDRLGRTSSKEQYAYFYRPEKLTLLDSYHFDDGVEPDDDLFQREPFVAHFESVDQTFDFAVAVIHTSPDYALEEVGLLPDVVADIATVLAEEDVVVLGDFNASCNYVREDELPTLSLYTDPSYSWWIDDVTDTTVSSTTCAYDRIVTAGDLSQRVVPDSGAVFYYDQAFVLDETMARNVSDHYPVEIIMDIAAEI